MGCLGKRLSEQFGVTGLNLMAIEMISSSAEIILCAQRQGYLDDDLNLTAKKIRRSNYKILGFQSGLIASVADISAEVRFWRSDIPCNILANMGVRLDNSGAVLRAFRRGWRGNKQPIS